MLVAVNWIQHISGYSANFKKQKVSISKRMKIMKVFVIAAVLAIQDHILLLSLR